MRRIASLFKEFQEQKGLTLGEGQVGDLFHWSNFRVLESAVERYCVKKNGPTETCKSGLKSGVQYLLSNVSTIVKTDYLKDERDEDAA